MAPEHLPAAEPAPVVLGPDADGLRVVMVAERVIASGRFERSVGVPDLPCPEARIRPGEVNAHTHLYSGLAPLGMRRPSPEPATFPEVLERIW